MCGEFVDPLMQKWYGEYKTAKGVEIDYVAKGSGYGISNVTSKNIEFGCTDAPMNVKEVAAAKDAGGEVSKFVDEGGELFDAVTFLVFGAVILGPVLDELTWQVVVYAVLSLTVVRMLPVALALIGTGARRATVGFLGWFGPRGLASIVFAVILFEEGGLLQEDLIVTTIVITIGLSVLVHGLTAAPLAGRYAAWYETHPRDSLPQLESRSAIPVRWRAAAAPAPGSHGGAPETSGQPQEGRDGR